MCLSCGRCVGDLRFSVFSTKYESINKKITNFKFELVDSEK